MGVLKITSEQRDYTLQSYKNIISVVTKWWPNWYYVDASASINEPPLVSALDHFKECVFEMVTFLFFVYMLKNIVNFDVFGGGPISFLINKSVRNHRLAK
eukprot:TRINITY_DN5530_c0_g1_i1.p1 TRINITY_DN5530_c0_g1~~TRINITY_DN5530_c0_g1_i1.p1  ORF type:complete len:108 (-),score=16.70 TRINITY_DN5530_c0_g1_i1:129-428(-)